jgi:hypothetical protein
MIMGAGAAVTHRAGRWLVFMTLLKANIETET